MIDKGQLKILARSDEEQIYLQFIDNGSGISKEDITKIFDAYYSTKTEGHGLPQPHIRTRMLESKE